MSGVSPHGQLSPRDYPPQIKLDTVPAASHAGSSSVPNVLTPGGSASRPPQMPPTSAGGMPGVHGMQDYQAQGKSPMSMSHNYSRSSPAANYDAPPTAYHAYTPTTPGGSGSQFGSPSDMLKYGAPGSQRNISNTPLGLADIRPRADSSMSDSPGAIGVDAVNAQPGPSNYLAPWAIYAFDWCKWRPQNNGAGKIAVGSYLEDGHNFVSLWTHDIACPYSYSYILDSNPRFQRCSHTTRCLHSRYIQILARIHKNRRSYTLIPRNQTVVGASFITKAVYRSSGYIGRSFASMVTANGNGTSYAWKHHYSKRTRSGDNQTDAAGPPIKL